MKSKAFLLTALFMALIQAGCNDDDADPNQGNDSIPLMYSDLGGVTSFILSDSLSVYLDISEWTCYSGPHPNTCYTVDIHSSDDSRLLLSYGGHQFGNLKKDSLIDSGLLWLPSYLSGGYYIEVGDVGYRSPYVGIKLFKGNHIYYGWIHTPQSNTMTEYAIDTSGSGQGVVWAGRRKKM